LCTPERTATIKPMENWNPRYGDCYFTPGEGINESAHVFFSGNLLEDRLPPALAASGAQFTIIETGYGTGLNALVTAALAARLCGDAGGTIRFFSVDEQLADDPQRLSLLEPELDSPSAPAQTAAAIRQLLAAAQSAGAEGPWRAWTLSPQAGPVVDIRVFSGDVNDFLRALADEGVRADAFYFDGHDPARNPAMWSPEVFRRCAALAAPGATAATYSAAGTVKRALRAAGFTVVRRRGYGKKRHMVTARFAGPAERPDG
jgi:tRNA U34 5-methylaminomethyl-2-thiouridine-forming methyltransferase MnmC